MPKRTAAIHVPAAFLALAALLIALLSAPPPARAVVAHELAVARGIELVGAGRYREALGPLGEALEAAPRNAEALFYAGVARSRLGEHRAAAALLRRALEEAESPEVLYELGRVSALTGACDDADRLFGRAATLAGAGATPGDTASLLASCRASQGRAFQASLTLGWQHDSNVVLDPDNPVTPAEQAADDRAVAYLAAGGTPLRAGGVALDVRYALYASRHADLEDYDAIDHRLAPTVSYAGWDAARPSLGYVFEHTSFGGDTYSAVHTGFLRVRVPEGDALATEATVEYRGRRFSDSALFPDNAERRGTGWAAVLRQELRRGAFEASVLGAYERDDARADWWDSAGWRAGARLGWRAARTVAVGVTGEYRAVDYDDPDPAGGVPREDRVTELGAALTWSPWRHVALTATASRTRDDSNLEAYTYTRTIYGLVATVGLGGGGR